MPNPESSPALLDGRAIVPAHRAMQYAYLWVLASLATAAGLLAFALWISERSEREAGRMIIASQSGSGYVAVLVNGFAQRHGRPTP